MAERECRGCGSKESTLNTFDNWGWCWGCRDFMEEQARDSAYMKQEDEVDMADGMAEAHHKPLHVGWSREY